jgi:hypothetical protein
MMRNKITMNRNKYKLIIHKNINMKNKLNSSFFFKKEKILLCKTTISLFLEGNELKPVYIYEKIHLDETRKIILKDTKGLSGIYLIFNKISGDYYVGSASTDKFYSRFSNHLLYFRGSKLLKHAVRKYSLSNFAFLIIELFPETVNKENNKNY